jgi:hypothetical protein
MSKQVLPRSTRMMPYTAGSSGDYGCWNCLGDQERNGMQKGTAVVPWARISATDSAVNKHVPLTGNIEAPAVPTTGIVDIVAFREQPTRHGIACIALGESFVCEQIDLCSCVIMACGWTCTHSRSISMLQS